MIVDVDPGLVAALASEYRYEGRKYPVDLPIGRDVLAEMFARFGLNRGAEIGVEQGVYSEVLCKANPDLQLLCVDAWQPYAGYRDHVGAEKLNEFYQITKQRLEPYKVKLLRAFSLDAAKLVPDGSLDFVYIDASHRYEHVVADLAAWVPKVRAGGIVAGHDMRRVKGKGYFHVPQAVHGWTSAYRIAPWFILRADSSPSWMWVQRG